MQPNHNRIKAAWRAYTEQQWREASAHIRQFTPVDVIYAVGTRFKTTIGKGRLAGDHLCWEDFIESCLGGAHD